MSLHVILEAIRLSGETKVLDIENQALAQASEILANARLEAQKIKEQACASVLEPASRERARIVHRAHLEALQLLGKVRKELVDTALEQTHGRLAVIRTDPIYPRVLRRLVLESLAELDGGRVGKGEGQSITGACLDCDPRDRALIESLLQELDLDVRVNYSLRCWGGVIARSEDGLVAVINTLDARLEKITPHLRRHLAALLEEDHTTVEQNRAIEWEAAVQSKSIQ
jgi:vacuolar-type H+-ATPase subunit E/Vma4